MRVWPFVSAALLLTAAPSRAEPADPAAAEALFRAGREAAERGDNEAACTRFEESYRLDPAPGTLLNIATCEEALNRLAKAWEHYRHLLDEMERNDPRRPTVRRRLSDLEPRLPRLAITTAPGIPAAAVVRRDGVLLNKGSFGVPLPVDPGDHEIVVTAEGYLPRSYAVRLAERETKNIDVEAGEPKRVEAVAKAPEPVPAKTPTNTKLVLEPAPPRTDPLRTLGFVSLGVGAASGVATGLLVWQYLAAHAVVSEQCNGANQCSDEGLRAAGAADALQTATVIAASVTLASLGVGAALLWTHPGDAPSKAGSARVPSGVVLSGSF